MTTFYTVLEISALLTSIILPLSGPKTKKKIVAQQLMSSLFVNENGFLEYADKTHQVH
jgi:hypothetical protein